MYLSPEMKVNKSKHFLEEKAKEIPFIYITQNILLSNLLELKTHYFCKRFLKLIFGERERNIV